MEAESGRGTRKRRDSLDACGRCVFLPFLLVGRVLLRSLFIPWPSAVDGAPFFDLRTASPTLQGASRLQNSTLSLTPAQADTIGAAFLPIPLPMLNTSFISSLTFCITLPPSGQAADGMAFGVFVLPEGATPGLGEGGAGMGYEGVSKDGWVVEIDTYQT